MGFVRFAIQALLIVCVIGAAATLARAQQGTANLQPLYPIYALPAGYGIRVATPPAASAQPAQTYGYGPINWPITQYNPQAPSLDPNLYRPTGAPAGAFCYNCSLATIGIPVVPQAALIQQTLRALPPSRSDLESRSISQLAWGARRALGTLYQNCDALRMDNLVPNTYRQGGVDKEYINSSEIQAGTELQKHSPFDFFTPADVAKTSFYVNRGARSPACADVSCSPPIFYVGYKPSIPRDRDGSISMNLRRPIARPKGQKCDLVAIDCSGFISASCAAAGLRIRRSDAVDPSYIVTAGSYANMGLDPKNKSDCFNSYSFKPGESIRSGDIFAIDSAATGEAYGHAMMIESVGRDPWGIGAIKSPNDCRPGPIDFRHFDFTIIQSSAALNRLAVSRMQASEFMLQADYDLRDMVLKMAINACYAQTTGKPVPAEERNAAKTRRLYALVRHLGPDAPGCSEPNGPASLGESGACMDECSDAQRGAPAEEEGDS